MNLIRSRLISFLLFFVAHESSNHHIIPDIMQEIEREISNPWDINIIYSMFRGDGDGKKFEYLLRDLYEDRGFKARVTPDSHDMGIDVIAKSDDEEIAIQAKCYEPGGNSVGNPKVRESYGGVADRGSDRLTVITTSGFVSSVYSLDFSIPLELIDGSGLVDMMNSSSLHPEDYLN